MQAMSLKDRLRFDPAAGAVHDGPRRYLLMRPDVLMGMLRRLPPEARAQAMAAFAESIADHGADSLRAYLAQLGGDRRALLDATAAAAGDLGWGRWRLAPDGGGLTLEVDDSPFAEGYGAADVPVCAPVRGMFGALAALALDAPMRVDEVACVAAGAPCCRFVAWPQAAVPASPAGLPDRPGAVR